MKINELLEKLKIDKKSAIVLLIGIFGIFLLGISTFFSNENINTNEDKVETEVTTSISSEMIESKLEERLEDTISQLSGVGSVTVMVSVASAGEYVYAQNTKNEKDSDKYASDSEIIIYEDENGETALVVSIKCPEILGVAVICDGGSSSVIKSEITQLVTSLFGIGSDRVYVGSKASK